MIKGLLFGIVPVGSLGLSGHIARVERISPG